MQTTTESAAFPGIPAARGAWSRGIHLVSCRVDGLRQSVSRSGTRAKTADSSGQSSRAHALQGNLYMLSDTRNAGPHIPHPGDILFWVVCIGAACLLLLIAT